MLTINSPGQEAIWNGCIAFALCSLWGLQLLVRGWRGEVFDAASQIVASRRWFIAVGLALQLPLPAFTFLVCQHGWFGI
jgi:hypothetical protein